MKIRKIKYLQKLEYRSFRRKAKADCRRALVFLDAALDVQPDNLALYAMWRGWKQVESYFRK